ncbi:MAG TPA: helix-turn-helix transcriptional regulator [Ilumatobacter sp.]|nr:helix-turn-helix transcriptional regulator [Ilumatobacter sp.]
MLQYNHLHGSDPPPDNAPADHTWSPTPPGSTLVLHGEMEPAGSAAELERHQVALDALGFGVVWIDEHGELLHANATATRILAIGADDARRRGMTWDMFRPRRVDGKPATIEVLMAGEQRRQWPIELIDATSARQAVTIESYPPFVQRWSGRREVLVLLRPEFGADPTDAAVAHRSAAPESPAHGGALAGIDLSAREREIVDLLLRGYRVASIAPRLYLSTHTIRNHLKSVFRKAGVTSQAELIELARHSTR